MSALGLLIIQTGKFIHLILNTYLWIVIISALLSWVNPDPYNAIVRFLRQITEPVYQIIQRRLPRSFFSLGLDITPLIVILLIIAIDTIGITLLIEFGISLRT